MIIRILNGFFCRFNSKIREKVSVSRNVYKLQQYFPPKYSLIGLKKILRMKKIKLQRIRIIISASLVFLYGNIKKAKKGRRQEQLNIEAKYLIKKFFYYWNLNQKQKNFKSFLNKSLKLFSFPPSDLFCTRLLSFHNSVSFRVCPEIFL